MKRRRYLRTLGSVPVASTITGCGSVVGDDPALDEFTVAYVPIYPNLQHFVMDDAGYYDELPVPVAVERFSSGPAVVQAFAGDEIDAALFGITPAMVLHDRGKEASVLAANSRNGFKFVGTTRLAELYDERGSAAFERFEETEGRQARIGAPPDGSVPDVVLRYWFEEELDLGDLAAAIEKSQLPPGRVPQSLQAGDLDGAIIQEPYATVITSDDDFRDLAWSGGVLPDHPVTVAFVQDRITEGAPEVARSFVERHLRATRLARGDPDAAAVHAATVIGDGVDDDLSRRAMESLASDFVSDPRAVAPQAEVMAEYVADLGNTDAVVSADRLFDYSVYDAVVE